MEGKRTDTGSRQEKRKRGRDAWGANDGGDRGKRRTEENRTQPYGQKKEKTT